MKETTYVLNTIVDCHTATFILLNAILLQVEKSFLWNDGGCRDVTHEKEAEQGDAYTKTEIYS